MAQYIQKFENGTPEGGVQTTETEKTTEVQETPKVRTYIYNNQTYNLDRLLADMDYNIDSYLNRNLSVNGKKLSPEQKSKVRQAIIDLMNGYDNETIAPKLGGKSHDSSGTYSNDSGIEYRIAQNFIHEIVRRQPVFNPDAEKQDSNLPKFEGGIGKGVLSDFNEYFGMDDPESFHLLDREVIDGNRSVKDRITYFSKYLDDLESRLKNRKLKYSNYDTDEKLQKLYQYIQDARKAIEDGQIQDYDRAALVRLGFDPKVYFQTSTDWINNNNTSPETTTQEESNPLADAINTYAEQQQSSDVDFLNYFNTLDTYHFDTINYVLKNDNLRLNYNNFFNQVIKPNLSDEKIKDLWNNRILAQAAQYVQNEAKAGNLISILQGKSKPKSKLNQHRKGNIGLYSSSNTANTALAIQLAALYYKKLGNTLSDGSIVIYSDKDNRFVYTYDFTNKKIQKKSFSSLKSSDLTYLQNLLAKHFNGATVNDVLSKYLPSNKQGGVLKAQLGDILIKSSEQIANEYRLKKAQKLQAEIEASGLSEEEYYKRKQKEERDNTKLSEKEWSASDTARAASIVADITSLISAFVPGYGTAVSAGTGVFGTVSNTAADIMDGENLFDIGKGFAMGIGLDVLGLIPGMGAGSKTTKLIKSAVKLAPKLLAAGTLLNPEVQTSVKKLMTDSGNITVGDWRNIAYAIKAVSGLGANAGTGIKRYQMKSKLKGTGTPETKTYKLSTVKDGKNKDIVLTQEQWNKFNKAKSVKDKNEFLKNEGFEDVSVKTTKILGKEKFDKHSVTVTTSGGEYDWSKVQGFGDLNDRLSDVSLYRNYLTEFNLRNLNLYDRITQQKSNKPFTPDPRVQAILNKIPSKETVISGIISRPPLVPRNHNPQNYVTQAKALMGPKFPAKISLESFLLNQNQPKPSIRFNPSIVLPHTRPANPGAIEVLPLNTLRSINRYKDNGWSYGPSGALGGPNARELASGIEYKYGGIINKINEYAKGGLIRKYLTGADITKNPDLNWKNNIYNNDLFKSFIKSYINKDNYINFNALQDSYHNLLSLSNYDPTSNKAWKNQGVLTRRKTFNDFVKNKAFNNIFQTLQDEGKITNTGLDSKSGNWEDDWFGFQEFLRHFGRKSDFNSRDELQGFADLLENSGLDFTFDDNGMLKLYDPNDNSLGLKSWKDLNYDFDPQNPEVAPQNPENPQNPETISQNPEQTTSIEPRHRYKIKGEDNWFTDYDPEKYKLYTVNDLNTSPEEDNGEYWYNHLLIPSEGSDVDGIDVDDDYSPPDSKYKKFNEIAEYALGAIDLNGILNQIRTNKEVLKKGYRPILHDPYQEQSPIVGDYYTLKSKQQQAADLLRNAANAATTDQMINTATMLDFHKVARQLQSEGFAADNKRIQETLEQARASDNLSRKSRIETANNNRDRIQNYNMIAAQIEADANLKRQEAFSNAIMEARTRLNQNISDYTKFHLDEISKQAEYNYQNAFSNDPDVLAWQQYQLDHKNEGSAIYRSQAYKNFQQAIRRLEMQKQNYINKHTAVLAGWPSYQYYNSEWYKQNVY